MEKEQDWVDLKLQVVKEKEILVLDLRGTEHDRSRGNHNREHNTQYQRHHQGSGDGFFCFSHEQASV